MSPHEIAQLAQTRRDDPEAAMAIATQAGQSHDAYLAEIAKETITKETSHGTQDHTRRRPHQG